MPQKTKPLKECLQSVVSEIYSLMQTASPIVANQFEGVYNFHLTESNEEELCEFIKFLYGQAIATGDLMDMNIIERKDADSQKAMEIIESLQSILKTQFESLERPNKLKAAIYNMTKNSTNVDTLCESITCFIIDA